MPVMALWFYIMWYSTVAMSHHNCLVTVVLCFFVQCRDIQSIEEQCKETEAAAERVSIAIIMTITTLVTALIESLD